MEFLIEVFAEVCVQLGFEFFTELGLRKARWGRPFHPVVAAFGYLVWGSILGGLSLVFFSDSFISHSALRWVNLLLTPVAVGGVMALVGTVRRRRGKDVIRIERFFYGYLFALGLAIVRFVYAG